MMQNVLNLSSERLYSKLFIKKYETRQKKNNNSDVGYSKDDDQSNSAHAHNDSTSLVKKKKQFDISFVGVL